MPRIGSSEQIDLQQGTVHSLGSELARKKKKSLVGEQSEIDFM